MEGMMGGHQPHVFANIEFFARMSACTNWVFSDDVKFNKKDWQNRNRIKSPVGDQLITVPVANKSDDEKIWEKELAYGGKKDWPEKLWKTLQMTYERQPYWKDLLWLEGLLMSKPVRLVELIRPMMTRFIEYLEIQTTTKWATELTIPKFEDASEKLAEQTKFLGCSAYVTGPQGWTYLKPEPFKARGLIVRSFLWKCPEYPQRWNKDGFMPNLSIVDVIANVGPAAKDLIRSGIRVGEGQWGSI